MTKQYDAAGKQLIDAYPIDWGIYLATRIGAKATNVEVVESNVSSITMQADKVFRLGGDAGLLHAELQSSWEGDVPDATLVYNALLDRRYGPPVKSVVVLLRPEANARNLTGHLQRVGSDGKIYLVFEYEVIRIWEESFEDILHAGFGLLPTALLTDEARADLPRAFQAAEERLEQANVSTEQAGELRGISYVLLGLRYDEAVIKNLYRGVTAMKESTTYQGILREGAAAELHKVLVRLGRQKWGSANEKAEAAIRAIDDLEQLERMVDAVLPSASWQELLSTP